MRGSPPSHSVTVLLSMALQCVLSACIWHAAYSLTWPGRYIAKGVQSWPLQGNQWKPVHTDPAADVGGIEKKISKPEM